MNEGTLIVVHCYQGDSYQVQSMLDVWTHHERPVLMLSPKDSPVPIDHPQVTNEIAGQVGWKGPHTLRRQVEHWKIAHKTNSSWYLLNDSDSMCLSAQLPEYLFEDPDIFWSNVLCHEGEHLETDQPNFNPPYFVSNSLLCAMIDAAEALEPGDGFLEPHDWGQAIDGFYTHLIRFALDAPWQDYPDGATTWPPGKADLVRDAGLGKRMIHGIKDETTLRTCLLAYNGMS